MGQTKIDAETRSARRKLGKRGEEATVNYLQSRGYQILQRNWRCKAGEADIVALDGDTLVFVEVKTRTDARKGFPEESVTAEKRSRYERIAISFLTAFDLGEHSIRFDVVSLMVLSDEKALVRHHINAFSTL